MRRRRERGGREQIFGEDEPPAGLTEAFRSLVLAKAKDIHALFADSRGKPREITVGGDEAEAIEPAAVQEVHGVNNQCDVGRVLADGMSKVLMRHDRVCR